MATFRNGRLVFTVYLLGQASFNCWCTGANMSVYGCPAELIIDARIQDITVRRVVYGTALPELHGHTAIVEVTKDDEFVRIEVFQSAAQASNESYKTLLAHIAVIDPPAADRLRQALIQRELLEPTQGATT